MSKKRHKIDARNLRLASMKWPWVILSHLYLSIHPQNQKSYLQWRVISQWNPGTSDHEEKTKLTLKNWRKLVCSPSVFVVYTFVLKYRTKSVSFRGHGKDHNPFAATIKSWRQETKLYLWSCVIWWDIFALHTGEFHKGRTYILTHLWVVSPVTERLYMILLTGNE